jgi:hypothetical protein
MMTLTSRPVDNFITRKSDYLLIVAERFQYRWRQRMVQNHNPLSQRPLVSRFLPQHSQKPNMSVLAERVDGFEESQTRFVFVGLRPLAELVVAVFEKTAMKYFFCIANRHFNC